MATSRSDWESRVASRIDPERIVALSRDALRFPTINPPGDERDLAVFLDETLRRAGIASRIVAHDGRRASVAGRLIGRGGRRGLILTGHLDVVGAGERPWTYGPFDGTVADGRLYGRGSADMKGAIAAMVEAARAIVEAAAPLRGDLILAFTAGEEVDSLGALALIESGLLSGADGIVIGEPSDLDVYVAEKGNLSLEIATHGRTAHASMPELGQNAIYAMADVIRAIESYRFAEQPHPLLGPPTMSVGVVRGGVRSNVVPDGCALDVDVRTLPGQRHDRVLDDLRSLLEQVRRSRPDLDAEIRSWLGREAVETSASHPLVADVTTAVADVTGRRPTPAGATYATDGAVLVPALDVAMAICGPGAREQAHQTDEHVEIERLVQAAHVYALVALRRLM